MSNKIAELDYASEYDMAHLWGKVNIVIRALNNLKCVEEEPANATIVIRDIQRTLEQVKQRVESTRTQEIRREIVKERDIEKEEKDNRKPLPVHFPKYVYERILFDIGQASMCWESPEKAGIFCSEKAIDIAFELCHFIADLIKEGKQ